MSNMTAIRVVLLIRPVSPPLLKPIARRAAAASSERTSNCSCAPHVLAQKSLNRSHEPLIDDDEAAARAGHRAALAVREQQGRVAFQDLPRLVLG